jgi:hypothetical protein
MASKFVSADASTYCTHDMQVYTGKKEDEP